MKNPVVYFRCQAAGLLPFPAPSKEEMSGGLMLRLIILVSTLAFASTLAAAPVHLTEEAIRQSLVGSLLEIDTPLGVAVPVRISADGLVSGEAGPLASTLGAAHDRGRWWIDHDQLCVKWFRWFEAQPRCLNLQREGQKIYWQDADGKSGTATITASNPQIATIESKAASETEPSAPADTSTAVSQPSDASPPAPARVSEQWEALRFAPMNLGLSAALAAVAQQPAATESLTSTPSFHVSDKAETSPVPSERTIPASRTPPARVSSWTSSFRVVHVVMDDALVVRSGPSEFHAAIGTIPADGDGYRLSATAANFGVLSDTTASRAGSIATISPRKAASWTRITRYDEPACSSMLHSQGRRPVRNNRSLLSQCLAHKGIHSVFSCQDADFSPDGAAMRSVLREPAVRG